MRLALAGSRPLWRVLLLALVGVITVVLAHWITVPRAFAQGYPGGVRDAEEWYLCSARRTNPSGSTVPATWDAVPSCFHLLWHPTGSGQGYESSPIDWLTVADRQQYDRIRMWIVPPAGLRTMTYRCDVTTQKLRFGLTWVAPSVSSNSHNALSWSTDGTSWSTTSDSPTFCTPSPDCYPVATSFDFNVVGTFRSGSSNLAWDHDPVAGFNVDSTSGYSHGVGYQSTSVAGSNSFGTSFGTCRIIGWSMWSVPWQPDEGSVVYPTPVPTEMAPTPTPVSGSNPWPTPVAWSPHSNQGIISGTLTVRPVTTACYTVLPSVFEDGVTVFGYSLGNFSVPSLEICLDEYDIGATVFGWNLGALVLATAALGAAGALYSLFKQG